MKIATKCVTVKRVNKKTVTLISIKLQAISMQKASQAKHLKSRPRNSGASWNSKCQDVGA